MSVYIHQLTDWPRFTWDGASLQQQLTAVRHLQGKLLGKMEQLGFVLQTEATLQTLTLDILKSGEIEGEILDAAQVRSSIARRLGIEIATLVPSDRHVDGVVEMMLNATQQYKEPLTEQRLFGWHASLFPTGYSGMHKIVTAGWRDNAPTDPMQVVSGPIGRETIHYEAPAAELLSDEMTAFLYWFNSADTDSVDPIIKSAIAHLWLVTIHPFDDGNGRIARAIADMQLARADGTAQRFYSMSAQIRKERNAYYSILEATQKGDLDITEWLQWFLDCIGRAIQASEEIMLQVLQKASFWSTHARTVFNNRQTTMLNKMLDGFEGKMTSTKWAKITKCSHDTALRDIQDLMSKNVLVKEGGVSKNSSYTLL
jgi:Fic family protein